MQDVLNTLYAFREEAVTALGLPTDWPITHADVERAATSQANAAGSTAQAALALTVKLAHAYVHARGWYRHQPAEESATLVGFSN